MTEYHIELVSVLSAWLLTKYILPKTPLFFNCSVREDKSQWLGQKYFSNFKLRRRQWLSKQTIMIVNIKPLKRPAVGVTWIMVFNLSNLSWSSGWLSGGGSRVVRGASAWLGWYPAGTWRDWVLPQCGTNALNGWLAVLLFFVHVVLCHLYLVCCSDTFWTLWTWRSSLEM